MKIKRRMLCVTVYNSADASVFTLPYHFKSIKHATAWIKAYYPTAKIIKKEPFIETIEICKDEIFEYVKNKEEI